MPRDYRKLVVFAAADASKDSCDERPSRWPATSLNAAGSASEAAYLVELSGRLGFLQAAVSVKMTTSFCELVAQLHAMVKSLSGEIRDQRGA